MKCKLARKSMSRYLDNELSASSRVALEAHLSQCPGCKAELVRQRRLWDLLGVLGSIEAPDVLGGIERRLAEPSRWSLSLGLFHRRAVGFAAVSVLLALFVLVGVWAGSTWPRTAQARGQDAALTELLSNAPAGMEFAAVCAPHGDEP